jgi:hypothetical protein
MNQGDSIIIVPLAIAITIWLIWFISRRMYRKILGALVPYETDAAVMSREATILLAQEGYSIRAGKRRIPITINFDGVDLESRLFVDCFAEKDGRAFIVKFSRHRKPFEPTGSGIRDQLLPYYLLYPQSAGVIYIDIKSKAIHTITFEIDK